MTLQLVIVRRSRKFHLYFKQYSTKFLNSKITVKIHEKLNQSSLFIHANSRSTQCSDEASEESMSSLAASRNYRSSHSLRKRQHCEECATRARKLLLEHLSDSFEDTRHRQFHRVGRNVEFALHPQHEASCDSEIQTGKDFKNKFRKQLESSPTTSLNSEGKEETL